MVDVRMFAFLATASACIVLNAAYADETHNHGHHHKHHAHEAHVHGAWELFAALDESQLSVTMKGPIIDVLGFERLPADEQERAAVETLKDQLGEFELMFTLSDRAGCSLSEPVQTFLPAGFVQEMKSDDPGSHEHNNTTHGQDHAENKHHHESHDVHASDVEINYVFDCTAPSRLTEINVIGFDSFPSIESIDAVFLGDATQIANRLGRNSQILKID